MFKAGDRVVVPRATNSVWYGVGIVDKMWDDDAVSLVMETGEFAGEQGTFRISEGIHLQETKHYVWRDYAGVLHLNAYLSSVPDDATAVWELGDELVRRVSWEKKDA